MKRHITITLALLSLILSVGACSKSEKNFSVDFTYKGCSPETKAGHEGQHLKLVQTDEGLAVYRNRATVNCSVKNVGMVCQYSISGNTITYETHVKDFDFSANCICTVTDLQSTVPGLTLGEEYILNYVFDGYPITLQFKYSKGLDITFDLDQYYE